MNPPEVSIAAVIGAGTMGAGIAGELARTGCRVRLLDADPAALDRGLARMESGLTALVTAGLVPAEEAEAARGRVAPVIDLARACDGVQLLVEAVREDLAIKEEIFAEFDRLCPADAILTSNTSGLSITRIAAATGRPAQVAGLHFWNPPHLIPLVEVTQGEQTTEATAESLLALARRMGKRPIRVRHDVPGFVGNRLQFAVLREALHLLTSGVASAEDIDTAMTAGPGLRYGLLGPLRTADLAGLDVFLAISRYLFKDLSSASEPPALLAELVAAGHLGAKAGQGFYQYQTDELQRQIAQRDRVLLGFLEVLQREGSR
ncbi:MAG: 3-hydroxyacyl-CoA dehydrogenase family protein [Candidatus Latescibacterota bacterium]|jgi:3-hydroxyacyl-CoA dehydrogenase